VAVVVLQFVAVVVEPAVVMSGAVGEELALRVVLADGLAVRGRVHVLDVSDLVLSLVAGEAIDEIVLAGKVLLSVIAVLKVREGSTVDTVPPMVVAFVVSCPVTAVVQPAVAPVLGPLLNEVAPEVTLRVVLTHGLTVTGTADALDLSD